MSNSAERRGAAVLRVVYDRNWQRVDLDHAALRSQRAQESVVNVARRVAHCPAATVGEHPGRRGIFQQLSQHVIRGVRRIEHDSEPIAFRHHLPAERTQATLLRSARIGRGIRHVVVQHVREAEHPDAQVEKLPDVPHVAPQRIAVLDAQIDRAFSGRLEVATRRRPSVPAHKPRHSGAKPRGSSQNDFARAHAPPRALPACAPPATRTRQTRSHRYRPRASAGRSHCEPSTA